ncbi:MAG: type IV pilus modification PilV family protein [Limisphaerales bacterium]
MKLDRSIRHGLFPRCVGFSLTEVVISLALAGLGVGGVISGYILGSQRAEWAAYTLAAHSLAAQRIEQTRAARWDTLVIPALDELTSANFPVQVAALNLPISGTNIVYATNTTTITTVSTNPPLRLIRVDSVWPFQMRGVLYTNTIIIYRGPDQ